MQNNQAMKIQEYLCCIVIVYIDKVLFDKISQNIFCQCIFCLLKIVLPREKKILTTLYCIYNNMFLRVLYISIMAFSAKRLLQWHHNAKKEKTKRKIETLSNEWDQLSQYVILLEQTAFQENADYEKYCTELESKITQLNYKKECFEDMKCMMTEMMSLQDIKPKEFHSLSTDMFEVMCELTQIQKSKVQLQQEFAIRYRDRDEKIQSQKAKLEEAKVRIAQIEKELSTLKLSS
jgi:hypothetical protein